MNKKTNRSTDMTVGSPARLLIGFGAPMFIGNVLQQLYNMTDSIVIGRLVGVEAFAAVGSAGWYLWLAISMVSGLANGFGVYIGQRYGARDDEGLRRAIAMSILLSAASALVMTPAFMLAARPMLVLLNTPSEIVDSAVLYLLYMYGGLVLFFAGHVFGSALRALGDSQTLVRSMILSSIVNIVLDILFVAAFHMGVAGVAIATLISILVSDVYCGIVLFRMPQAKLSRADFVPDKFVIAQLLRLGGVPALRDAVIAVGGLAVQYMINGYGVIYVAGMTAAKKLFGIMELISYALQGALATFVAQNFGAKNYGRIKKGVRSANVMALCGSVGIAAIMLIFGRLILMLFIEADQGQVLDAGYKCLAVISVSLPALYMLYMYRAALEGMGAVMIPALSGFVELAMRVIVVLVLPIFLKELGVYMAESVGWVGAMLLLGISYWHTKKKLLD